MKRPVLSGDAVNLDERAKETRVRRERARSILEPTLPWRVNVQFLDQAGEPVCEWGTGLVLRHWRDRVSMAFSPETDIEVDE